MHGWGGVLMSPATLIFVYCLLVALASLGGGTIPSWVRLTHQRMNLIMSFVAGVLLGMGLWHMLPHAAAAATLDRAVFWMMVGLLTSFLLSRTLTVHQHGHAYAPDGADETKPVATDHGASHVHPHRQTHSWIGLAYGMSLHTFIDGIALAAGVQADALVGNASPLLGAGTFLAVLLHKPLDSMSITSLMAFGGWDARWRRMVNAGFALICPLGALFFFFVLRSSAFNEHVVVGCALAFAAGVFVCIALGDLLPELQFHPKDRFKLSATLLLGVVLAYGTGMLEPNGAHHPGHDEQPSHQEEHKH